MSKSFNSKTFLQLLECKNIQAQKELEKLTEEEINFLLSAHDGDFNNKRIILSNEDTKKYYDLVYKIKRNFSKSTTILTFDNVRDFYQKIDYKELTKEKEYHLIKKAKLSFYDKVDDETKELYIKYYMEEFPNIKEKYENAKEEEKQIILDEAIENSCYWRDVFIENNQCLILSIARRIHYISNTKIPLIDLISEGNIGALIALQKFDIERNNRFSTCAVNWIRQSISRAIDDKEYLIRIPVHAREKMRALTKAEDKLIDKFRRTPTVKELAAHTEFTEKQVYTIKNIIEPIINPASLNEPFSEEGIELGDVIPDFNADFTSSIDNNIFNKEMLELINDSNLNTIEKNIIYLKAGLIDGEPKTLEEISKLYGITKKCARQIESAALKKAKKTLMTSKKVTALNYKETNVKPQTKKLL